jgi:hypothetical protein
MGQLQHFLPLHTYKVLIEETHIISLLLSFFDFQSFTEIPQNNDSAKVY